MRNPAQKIKTPLKSWDIFSQHLSERAHLARQEKDKILLEKLKSKHGWNIDLTSLLKQKHTALVLTNHSEEIQWVNIGFTTMTGYSKKDTLGRHPRFLQGESTSKQTKNTIRVHLDKREPVTKKLINYKKNGDAYLCDIRIFPLSNHTQEVTHFLALESKSKVA
jgi:PAS domain S-box-containing protein